MLNQILNSPFLDVFLDILIILILTFITMHILSFLINRFWKRFNMDLTLLYLLQEVIKYVIIIYAIAWILKLLGVDLSGIIISLGVIGIIVGFAAKDIFSNVMSGIILVADKRVKVGEVISVNNVKGMVKRVDFRKTTLETVDGYKVTVPNSLLSTTAYTNFPKLELNKLKVAVNVPYGIDLKTFNDEFMEKFKEIKWILSEKKIIINKVEPAEFGNTVEILLWIDDYSKLGEYQLELTNELQKIIEKHKQNKA